MAKCEVCGNDYDKAIEVIAAGAHHTFDSFECAIHAFGAYMRALPHARYWPRRGSRWPFLLLRSLRAPGEFR